MKKDPYLFRPDQVIDLHGIEFPLELLHRGTLIVGQPGAGKTRCILMPLLRSILLASGKDAGEKAGMAIADPKGELGPFIESLLREVGREDDLVVLKPDAAYYNPLDNPFFTDTEIVEKIIGFAAHTNRNAVHSRGDEAFWSNALRSLLSAVVSATRVIHGGKLTFSDLNHTFRRINRFQNASDGMGWMQENHLPEETINGIRDFLNLPEGTTRPCVATSLANTIYFWQNEPLRQLTTPQDDLPGICPFNLVHHGKILLIGCSNAAFGVSISPLLVALKEHLFATLLSRDQIEVYSGEGEWQLLNQKRPVFFIADEFQSYVSPSATMGELVALDRLRSFKGAYIAATQNLASLHSVLGSSMDAIRLISLLSNQIFLGNICPQTAAQAEQIFGKKRIREQQKELSHSIAPPLLFRRNKLDGKKKRGTVIETSRQVPRVDATTLSAMRTGEFYCRLANGEVHHKTAPFVKMVQSK